MKTIFNAIETEDAETVKQLLELGIDVNQPCQKKTAFFNSFPNQQPQLPLTLALELLLGFGDKQVNNPANLTIIICSLIEAGANVRPVQEQDRNWLHCLCADLYYDQRRFFARYDNLDTEIKPNEAKAQAIIEISQCLLKADITLLNERDDMNETPLLITLNRRNEALAVSLIEAGADLTICDGQGDSPLHIACKYDIYNVVQLLIAEGIDINTVNTEQLTPLDCALQNPEHINFDIVLLLLQQGATGTRYQPIHLLVAAYNAQHHALWQYLLEQGIASLAQPDGLTALHLADSKELMLQLLEQDKQFINAVYQPTGVTPLLRIFCHSSCLNKRESCIALFDVLKANGADINAVNHSGENLLHMAVKAQENSAVLSYFIEQGVPLNVQNTQGQTALHLAAAHFEIEAVATLLQKQADTLIKDNEGHTALECICISSDHNWYKLTGFDDQEALIKLIFNLMVRSKIPGLPSNAQDLAIIAAITSAVPLMADLYHRGLQLTFYYQIRYQKRTLLSLVTQYRHKELLSWLLNNGLAADYHAPDEVTALQLAVQELDEELMELLLQHGADPRLTDRAGQTLLMLVADSTRRSYRQFTSLDTQMQAAGGIFKKLLKLSATDINQQDLHGNTVLKQLIERYCYQSRAGWFIYSLLQAGAVLNNPELIRSLIRSSVKHRHIDIFKQVLLNRPEDKTAYLVQAAVEAIGIGHVKFIEYFVEQGLDLKQRILCPSGEYLYPLEYAMSLMLQNEPCFNIVNYLLTQDLESHFISTQYPTLLLAAVKLNAISLVEQLLKQPNHRHMLNVAGYVVHYGYTKHGLYNETSTPLQLAVNIGYIELVELLLSNGADPRANSPQGINLLQIACLNQQVEMVQVLLKVKLDINELAALTSSILAIKMTPLEAALCGKYHPEITPQIVHLLLEHGAKVTKIELYRAITRQIEISLLEILIARLRDDELFTIYPLHLAVQLNNLALVDYLLAHKPMLLESKNLLGWTPLYYAVKPEHNTIYQRLIQHGADRNGLDYLGESIAHYALYYETSHSLGLQLANDFDEREYKKLQINLQEQQEFIPLLPQERAVLLGRCCYKLITLFGNAQTSLEYLKHYQTPDSRQPIHDACLFNLPVSGNWTRHAWAQLALAHGPVLLTYLHLAPAIEAILQSAPISIEAVTAAAKRVTYRQVEKHAELAALFLKHHIAEHTFERIISQYQPKLTDKLPPLYVNGADFNEPAYYFKKLAVNDLRGFVLGALTHCCQSAGSAGEVCAMQGMQSAYGGFYAVFKKAKSKDINKYQQLVNLAQEAKTYEDFLTGLKDRDQRKRYRELQEQFKKEVQLLNHSVPTNQEVLKELQAYLQQQLSSASEDELIAQSWAWLSRNGNLVFDSWERLRTEDDRLCQPFLILAAEQAINQYAINQVLIGASGQTPENLPFAPAEQPEIPYDYLGYRDSDSQLIIATRKLNLTQRPVDAKHSDEHLAEILQVHGLFQSTTVTTQSNPSLVYTETDMMSLLRYHAQPTTILLPIVQESMTETQQAELRDKLSLLQQTDTQSLYLLPIQKQDKGWACILIQYDTSILEPYVYYLDPAGQRLPYYVSQYLPTHLKSYNFLSYLNTAIYETDPYKGSVWLVATLAQSQMGGRIIPTPIHEIPVQVVKQKQLLARLNESDITPKCRLWY